MLVPAKAKEAIHYALFRLGTHASSLFPDVDGLAARLRWQHAVRSPFEAPQLPRRRSGDGYSLGKLKKGLEAAVTRTAPTK